MQLFWKSSLLSLAILTLAAVAGCQRGSDSAPTASVGGPGGNQADSQAQTEKTPKSDQDPLHPVVEIDTSLGRITVRLDMEKAPITVDNFLNYIASGHFDGTIFHQVRQKSPGIILGGAYTAELVEKKSRTAIRNEAHNGLQNRRGTIAMARRPDHEDTATCHFFFNLTDNEMLDHKTRTAADYGYCVFGEIVGQEGLETIDRVGAAPTRDLDKFQGVPSETVLIRSVRRVK